MPSLDVHTEVATGIVYSTSSVAIYVHDDSVETPVEAAQQAARIGRGTPEGTTRIDPLDDQPRSHTDRAVLLALLIDRIGLIDLRHDDVVRSSVDSARIPVKVAADGTAAIACYLAIHGLDNSEIADLLDVGSRTVSQYISDFRKGER